MPIQLLQEDLPQYSYEDYLIWEGKWELINGFPYAMAPSPIWRHQRISTKMIAQLENSLKRHKNCLPTHNLDWKISKDTVVEPDVMVVCGKFSSDFLEFPPTVIFEILSPSTKKRDKNLKYRLYESEGIKYYVIVDPKFSMAEVYQLNKGKYEKSGDFTDEIFTFQLGSGDDIDFSFSEIWSD